MPAQCRVSCEHVPFLHCQIIQRSICQACVTTITVKLGEQKAKTVRRINESMCTLIRHTVLAFCSPSFTVIVVMHAGKFENRTLLDEFYTA